jgi:type II secretory pathway component PulJ
MSTDQDLAEKPELITIQEEADGSATVELPESIPSPDPQPESEHEDSDEADERARQAELASGGEVDPDAEAMREAKRQKRKARKEYHRNVEQEKNVKIQHLERANQELLERMAVLEKKSHGSELARLNKAIEDQHARIAFAKQKISEAGATGNGDLHANAMEMWFEAKRNAEALENIKKKATAPRPQQTIQPTDPAIQNFANQWMSNNSWYDPKGRDSDSKIALTIDAALAEEGYSPKNEEFWEELDNRLQKYLPHRYTNATNERQTQRKHRNVVTSSGREAASSSGGRNTFTLNTDQVRAMKEAGMWDDPDKRAKMIARYAKEARQNNGYRS